MIQFTPLFIHRAGARAPNWSAWHEHFAVNAKRPNYEAPLPGFAVTGGEHLPADARRSLLRSLAIFQLGESGEGRIAHEIDGFHAPGIDEDYRAALKYFVKEEGRHARGLAFLIRGLGGRTIGGNWTEKLFHFGRRLMGVRLKMLVLLAAEIVGIVFYVLMARRLRGEARRILREIRADEIAHMRFHCDFFRLMTRSPLARPVFRWAWRLIYYSAALAVLLDHGRSFFRLGYSPRRLLGHWFRLSKKVEARVLEADIPGTRDSARKLS